MDIPGKNSGNKKKTSLENGHDGGPELIAESYWEFVRDAAMSKPAELVFRG